MSQGTMGNMTIQKQAEAAPGLFTFLWGKYVELNDGDDAMCRKADCVSFINFAENYLCKNRPTLTFTARDNVGCYLGAEQRVVIAPPVTELAHGEMAPTVLPNQGAVMITGNAKKQPGAEDMKAYDVRTFENKGGKAQSATVQRKAENLAQDDPYVRERQ